MIVLDTHAWIWWLSLPRLLSRAAHSAIERADTLGVATVSCWEVGLLAERGRMRLERDVETWVRQALLREPVRPLPLTAEAALAAALLEREIFPRDPADRMIYATARAHGAPLVTRDRAIRAFDPAGTIW